MLRRPVTFLTNTLTGGGAEKQLLITAAGLARRGCPCSIFVLSGINEHGRYSELLARCQQSGVTMVSGGSLPKMVGIIVRLSLGAMRHPRAILWTWGFRAEALRLALPPLWLSTGVVAIRLASESEVAQRRRLLAVGRRMTRCYISNTHLGIELVEGVAPGVIQKSAVIYNAVECGAEASGPKSAGRSRGLPLKIVMLGNIKIEHKGYDVALQVFETLQKEGLPFEVVIGGRQVEGEQSITEMIRRAGLERTVRWAGTVENTASFLADGDVFLLTSRCEGTPNALLEAMAAGLPCITTDVGDIRRLFEREESQRSCYIVPRGDVEAICGAVRWMEANPRERYEMGRRAQQTCCSQFSESAMIDEVERVLTKLG